MSTELTALQLTANEQDSVSAIVLTPTRTRAALVLAHGAGAGMEHPFMQAVARGFARRSIASLRFQFPYMEKALKRPDPPGVAMATVRAAVAEAARLLPGIPLFAGGKSFGARMTSQAQADAPLPGVLGLVFIGFPLHPAGKPSMARADHLTHVQAPMLFLQGTRDTLADVGLLKVVLAKLGARATLTTFADADHSFHVRKSSGSSDNAVLDELIDCATGWMLRLVPHA